MNLNDVLKDIKIDEGLSLKPYKDVLGVLTIGYGRNLRDNGITEKEADLLALNDITRCNLELTQFDWFEDLTDNRRKALLNMCFNIGITKFKGFKKMIKALENHDYLTASKEMLDSRWHRDFTNWRKDKNDKLTRSFRLSEIIKNG